jgi:hypothetical protein
MIAHRQLVSLLLALGSVLWWRVVQRGERGGR